MKQIFVITCLAVILTSCNNAATTKTVSDTTVAATPVATAAVLEMPFKLEKPYRNWQIGSTENVVAAMNAFKNYLDKDFTALAAAIGDSITLRFDNFAETVSRDSAIKMFMDQRPLYDDVKITMYDYVSVISADKSEEWVTLWYKQSWKKKGKDYSMAVTDDIKLKNGKMIELDEKTQHYPVKKK